MDAKPAKTPPLDSPSAETRRPHLALHLLGAPRIYRDGVEMAVDTRKALALVAYLARTGQPHSRDALAALLWPDYDPTHARATLRRTLSALNKALGGQALTSGRETIALGLALGLWVDVTEFERRVAQCRQHGHALDDVCPLCVEPLNAAAELYTGDFLAGFGVRESADFEEWQFFQAQGLRRELASVLERLARAQAALGDFEAAIGHARRWLALDRLHEPAHRELMRLYAWSGQRTAALRQYRECVQVLERELGVEPLDETTRLYEAIKEGGVSVPPPLATPANASAPPRATPIASPPGPRRATSHSGETSPDHAQASSRPPTHDADSTPPDDAHSRRAPRAQEITPRYPLVGRDREWDRMRRAYDESAAQGCVVIIVGEAGIGKTRLAQQLAAHARARGARILAAQCYEGESTLAYGPIASALRAAVAQDDHRQSLARIHTHSLLDAARLVPEIATIRPDLAPPPSLDAPGARGRFFEGLREVVLALLTGPVPGILYLDDLQWADSATIDLIAYIARRLDATPLCLLLTWRGDQVTTERRLARLITERGAQDHLTIVSLTRLSHALVEDLMRAVARIDHAEASLPPGPIADRIFEESEGLPLFVVEYLSALRDGSLAERSADWAIPGGVRDVMRSRLAGVDGTAAQLLTTAAVIGRSFDFDTLRSASGRSEIETIDGLEALIGRGLIRENQDDRAGSAPTYDFTHEKLRAVVYEDASLARRRLLHRRVADALAARSGRAAPLGHSHQDKWTQPGLIARHFLLGGNEAMAAEYFKMAGERARAVYANAEAMAHFQTALALGHSDVAALHTAIGDLHALRGEYSAALKSYETAAAHVEGQGIAIVERKLGDIYARRGDWDLAESQFQAAADELRGMGTGPVPHDPLPGAIQDELVRIYCDWSLTAHHRGESRRAGALAQAALAAAEMGATARARAQVHNILGVVATSNAQLDEARTQLEQSLRFADVAGDPGARAAAMNNLALAYGASGDMARALDIAEAALTLCRELGDRHREAALLNNIADLLHRSGRADGARARVEESVRILAEISAEGGDPRPAIWTLAEW